MRYRVLIWMAAAAPSFFAGTASAQKKPIEDRGMAPVPVVRAEFAFQSATGTTSRPAFRQAGMEGIRFLHLPGLTVEKERNTFISQLRIPLTSLFGGRIKFAAVYQRLRSLNEHSAVAIPDGAAALRSQQPAMIPARTAASWGGGIWFQIGRPRA